MELRSELIWRVVTTHSKFSWRILVSHRIHFIMHAKIRQVSLSPEPRFPFDRYAGFHYSGFTVYFAPVYSLQDSRSPNAELCGLCGINTITNGNNCIEVVERDIALYGTTIFILNCFQNGNSCGFTKLSFLVYVFQMFRNARNINIKQLGHRLLRQPNTLVFDQGRNLDIFFRTAVKNIRYLLG